MSEHALYRFFDKKGTLLYVGITMNPGERFKQHRDDKPWWGQVSHIEIEPYPSREEVLAAERAAILAERPLNNVIHNGEKKRIRERMGVGDSPKIKHPHGETVMFFDRSGHRRVGTLWLVYELEMDPISDDYLPSDISARDLMRLWRRQFIDAAERHGRGTDDVPISWHVRGCGVAESATPGPDFGWFGDYYTMPVDAFTKKPVPIVDLPIETKRWSGKFADKGGFIPEVTGWEPSPLQASVPLSYLDMLADMRGRKRA